MLETLHANKHIYSSRIKVRARTHAAMARTHAALPPSAAAPAALGVHTHWPALGEHAGPGDVALAFAGAGHAGSGDVALAFAGAGRSSPALGEHAGIGDVALAFAGAGRSCPAFLVLNPAARAAYSAHVHAAPTHTVAPAPFARRCVPWLRAAACHNTCAALLCTTVQVVCLVFWIRWFTAPP